MLHCQNGNKAHYHLTLEEAQKCFGTTVLYVSNAPLPVNGSLAAAASRATGWRAPDAPWRSKPVKEETQIPQVKKYGGSVKRAMQMNRGQCSDYIDGLKSGTIPPEPDEEENRPVSAPPVPVSAPPAPPPVQTPQEQWVAKTKTKVLTPLLKLVPDGYYAVQLEENSPMHFIRVSRPKTGQYKDTIKVQTMHGTGPGYSDYKLEEAFILWPSDRVSVYKVSLEDPINLLIADHKGAATLYAKTKKRCMSCNAALTDPVSRKYGVGPECIKTPYGQRIKEEVDEAEALQDAS